MKEKTTYKSYYADAGTTAHTTTHDENAQRDMDYGGAVPASAIDHKKIVSLASDAGDDSLTFVQISSAIMDFYSRYHITFTPFARNRSLEGNKQSLKKIRRVILMAN